MKKVQVGFEQRSRFYPVWTLIELKSLLNKILELHVISQARLFFFSNLIKNAALKQKRKESRFKPLPITEKTRLKRERTHNQKLKHNGSLSGDIYIYSFTFQNFGMTLLSGKNTVQHVQGSCINICFHAMHDSWTKTCTFALRVKAQTFLITQHKKAAP